ncbi:MAG: anaerobic ribonucleoside-triphosphate reductase activating protein [Acidaminococcaceae bacterium]|jgi:pyruvate formate lyase activating enzyme|nr:anaerobic ribonucleoside-triphosphate reductase activating protein [Acidaminococcaceae bacterium]
MKLLGLQKLTLLDFPGRMACTVFTGGCNFRCPFCHNASLVVNPNEQDVLPVEEFFAFLEGRKGLLDGVCVSGGEPLIQPDIEEFISRIKKMGFLVKLDTNGSYPETLKSLVDQKLVDYVAMDIKNSKENYFKTSGTDKIDLARMEQSAALLMEGTVPYEFRTTVVKELHSEEDFVKIGQWLSPDSPYFLQGFVDSGDIIGSGFSGYKKAEMEKFAKILRKTLKKVEIRGM